MKIAGIKFARMKGAVKAVVDNIGPSAVMKKRTANQWSESRLLWELWNAAQNNLIYNDGHPCFANCHWTRVYPHCEGFNVYSDGINDAHIETALRKIAKELGII